MRTLRPLLHGAALLASLVLATDAAALLIDNFEEGPFSLAASPGGSDSGSQVVSAAGAIASPRQVSITSNGDFCTADLSVSATTDDEVQMVMGRDGGLFRTVYSPGQVDLTGGGVFNRLDVDFTVAVAAGVVRVELIDITGLGNTVNRTVGGPGKLIFPFADFPTVDLTRIQDIVVTLDTPSAGDYHLTDIRVTESPDQGTAAAWVLENLDVDPERTTLWSHDQPVDGNHVLRTLDPRDPDIPLPYAENWVFMIDDNPGANWAHPVRWVVVSADLGDHVVYEQDWIPSIVSDGGTGSLVDFGCIGATSMACPALGPQPGSVTPLIPGLNDGCLYAVLISGGWTDSSNYSRYAENLTSMYQRLREIGYPKSHIWTYYADGTQPLDMDNLDGDNNHATGNDVTAGAVEALIRARIQALCTQLNANRDVLFVYTSNHGASDGSLMLWEWNANGMAEDDEFYSPAEMAADMEDCSVCRNFVLVDQCYSGAFTPMATDGNHPNTAVYAAATANEVSWGREYLDWWEDLDIANLTMNQLHQSVVNSGTMGSTPVMSQTNPGTGDVTLDYCWGEETFHIPSDATFCGINGTVEVEVAICNELPSTQYYDLDFQGLPTGPGCDVPGPTLFLPAEQNPIIVLPGECKTVKVTIGRPDTSNGPLVWTSCYQATLTNSQLGYSRTVYGELHGAEVPLLCMEIPAESHVWLDPLDLVTVTFPVLNDTEEVVVFDYQIDAVASDGLAQNLAISLNDQAPGQSARGSVAIGVGELEMVSVDVMLTDATSNIFYDLQLSQQAGKASTVLGSIGLRKTGSVTTSADPTPRVGPVAVDVVPNPFNPRTEVVFHLERGQDVRVDVLDARGRRIRSLHTGSLVAGEHRIRWDGVDDGGRRVASGTYFVQVRTPDGDTVRKATLLK